MFEKTKINEKEAGKDPFFKKSLLNSEVAKARKNFVQPFAIFVGYFFGFFGEKHIVTG